ncbi:MAG: hypothetical protein KJO20_06120, partial [Eudoraea sp.]|nr:hypothetical protein [Eudoraea sp.]
QQGFEKTGRRGPGKTTGEWDSGIRAVTKVTAYPHFFFYLWLKAIMSRKFIKLLFVCILCIAVITGVVWLVDLLSN